MRSVPPPRTAPRAASLRRRYKRVRAAVHTSARHLQHIIQEDKELALLAPIPPIRDDVGTASHTTKRDDIICRRETPAPLSARLPPKLRSPRHRLSVILLVIPVRGTQAQVYEASSQDELHLSERPHTLHSKMGGLRCVNLPHLTKAIGGCFTSGPKGIG